MHQPMHGSVMPHQRTVENGAKTQHRIRRKSLRERMRSWCCRRASSRLSLRTTISLLLITFITLTCVLVWYLGYLNLNHTISDFTFLHRRGILALVQTSIEANLQLPVKAVGQVTAMLQERITINEFRHNANLSTVTGFLLDVDCVYNQLGGSYVEGMGYGTAAGFYAHRQILRSDADSFIQDNVTMGFAWSEPDQLGLNTIIDFNFTSPPQDPLRPACTPVAFMPKQQMIKVLNPPYNSFPGYTPVTRPWYQAAVAAGGAITWTAPFKLLSIYAENTVVATVQGIVDPSNGEVVAVTWAFCYLRHITQLITSLDVGPNGMVMLFDTSGLILSSSHPEFAGLIGNVRLQESSDELLLAMAQVFATSGSGIPQMSNSSFLDLSRLPTNTPVTVHGHRYHLSSTTVRAPGMMWILTVLTLDSDWTGTIAETNRDTALLGLAILLGAFVVAWCIASSMVLPMKAMIMFMKEFGVMSLAAGGMDEDGEANDNSETKTPPDFEHLFQMWKLAMGEGSMKKSKSTADRNVSRGSAFARSDSFNANPDADDKKSIRRKELEAAYLHRDSLAPFSCMQFIDEIYLMKSAFGQMLQEAKNAHRQLDYQKHAKRQFIRYVFHEVRVPLNALLFAMDHVHFLIKEHTEKIERQKSYRLIESKTAEAELEWLAEARDMMNIQKEQGIVMSRILNDVLTFQKIEDGALSLEMSVFNIQELIQSAVHSFAAQFHSAGLQVQVDCSGVERFNQHIIHSTGLADHSSNESHRSSPINRKESAYLVVGDRLRIRQVLSNFISNAIKFTDAGGTVTVMLDVVPNSFSKRRLSVSETKQQSPSPILGRATFKLSVADTGKGMSKERVKCLFSHSEACEVAKLTPSGLGLSICKRLSDLFGGEIGCSSTLKAGSTFFVTLPLDIHSSCQLSPSTGIGHQVRSSANPSFVRPSISSKGDDSRGRGASTPPRTNSNVARLLRHANMPSNDYASYNGAGTHLVLNRSPLQARKNTVRVAFDPDGHCEVHSISVPIGSPDSTLRHEHHSIHQIISDDHFVHPSSVVNNYNNNNAPPSYELYDSSDSPTPAFEKLPSYEFKAPPLRGLTSHIPPIASPSASPESSFLRKPLDQQLPSSDGETTAVVASEACEPVRPALFRRASPPMTVSHPLNRRLLVVEDSAPNRKLLMMALKSLGWEVDGVPDGRDAIEYFERIKAAEEQAIENLASLPSGTAAAAHEHVAAVFMDNFMEHVSGVEATRAIRSMGFTLPIIGVTGSAMDEDCKEFIEAGVSTILTKPVGGVKALEATLQSYGLESRLEAGKMIRSTSSAN